MTETRLVWATVDDVEFLVRLLHAVYDWGDDAAAWAEARRRVRDDVENGTGTYVVHAGGERVGRLHLVRTPERLHLAGIQLHPDHQGRGIGTALIEDVLDEARRSGLPVELEVAKTNPDAERLYTRLGFRRYGEQGDDHLLRHIAPSPRVSLSKTVHEGDPT